MGRFKFADKVCWNCRDCTVHVDGPKCSECGKPVPKPINWLAIMVWLAAIVGLVLLPAVSLFAGTPKQQAIAAVVVARTQLQIASERPDLNDHKFRTSNPPEANGLSPATDGTGAVQPVAVDALATSGATDATSSSGGGFSNHPAFDNAVRKIADAANRPWIEIKSEVPVVAKAWTAQKRKATVYTGESKHGKGWCRNCPQLKARWGSGNADIEITWSDAVPSGPQIYPAVRFHDGVEERYPANQWGDYKQISQLSELVELIDRNVKQPNVSSSGPAGAIHASGQINQALTFIRENIGENVPMSFRWDRSGNQRFPLVAKADWSALAIFGGYGHVELSAKGSKLPIDAIGFGYRVDGENVSIDLDSILLKGLAAQLGVEKLSGPKATAHGSPVPSQFGVLTALSIVSAIHSIVAILQPSVDLNLGGNVAAVAVLHGDELTIDFSQCPRIKATWLMTFDLGVEKVVVSPSQVFLGLSGSRWIKSRTFSVED